MMVGPNQPGDRSITVSFDEFGWESLVDAARANEVSVEDLVVHAALVYLAEPDKDRISRRPLKLAKRDGE